MNRREFLKSTAGLTGVAVAGMATERLGGRAAWGAGGAGTGAAASNQAPAPAAPLFEGQPSAEPITPNTSPEAKAVLKYIQQNFGKKILAAQHGGMLSRAEYVNSVTGKYPAIWGTDLINRNGDDRNFAFVTDVWKRGAIPTVMWHWGAPTLGDGYEQSKGKIDVNQCFVEGTPENKAMWVDLKSRADFLTRLRDAKVPVIWRPYHECSGGWFWWDKSGPEAFKKLWKTMYDYFTKERGLNNLLWVLGFCGTPKATYHTGEGTYDILGGDVYAKAGPYADLYGKVKTIGGGTKTPICLHECGVPPVPEECEKAKALWSWFMVWDSFIQGVDKTLLKNIYTSDLTITLDKLPKWADLIGK